MSASTALITDMKSAVADTPTAASMALATAAAGPIQDLTGNLSLCLMKLNETKTLLTTIKQALDNSDPILTLVNNVLATLT